MAAIRPHKKEHRGRGATAQIRRLYPALTAVDMTPPWAKRGLKLSAGKAARGQIARDLAEDPAILLA